MPKRIVFWGDSITDSLRDQKQEIDKCGYTRAMGSGYVRLIESALGLDYPQQYEVINRGISGNRIVDLYARIKADMINLKPDVISILIGINDVGHEYAHNNGVDAAKFEMVYDWMIQELKQALPNVQILIMEPFLLPGSSTITTEDRPDRWEFFSTETLLRQQAAKRIAEKHGLLFVPLQETFQQVDASTQTMGYWLGDGVHPNGCGHELIKRKWLEVFLGK